MEHTPVLLKESIDGLNIKPGGTYVDGTLGRAGHAREIVKRFGAGRLIAIDRDNSAIQEAKASLKGYDGRITFIHGNFRDLSKILDSEGLETVDGMLFDLGVSSPQLDDAERGFSYMQDARLDMRMDESEGQTAFEAVNNWQEDKLRRVFYEYGEERYSKSIASAIVKKRMTSPINTTFELNEIIFSAIPAAARREAQHPSKRCFQALRIAINDELGAITEMLDSAPSRLKTGGRLCVISFHSLEDRIVKRSFNAHAERCVCPKDMPVCACGVKPTLKVITKKPLTADKEEAEHNTRSRSAKLRIAERL
jgi:16S rRNA (cytosine1402-N4)-methyltransferase